MDNYITGATIKRLREAKGIYLLQQARADEKENMTHQAVRKAGGLMFDSVYIKYFLNNPSVRLIRG